MPSPFPGMDPYLEDQYLWPSVHTQLLVEICRDLQPQLVPNYVARTERRVLVEPLDRSIRPDVYIRERAESRRGAAAVLADEVADEVAVPEEISVPELTIPHRFIEIRDARSHEVVTVIEVLSPWNKMGDGYEEYRLKQREVLRSAANLVEIDLLRRGRHTIAAPEEKTGLSDYRICVHRARRDSIELIRLTIRDALPSIAVPLRHGEPDVILHLGTVFARVYDDGAYHLEVDYSGDAIPPLSLEDAAWARERIRWWGGEAPEAT